MTTAKEQLWETIQREADRRGRVPDPPRLVALLGNTVTLHDLVHLLWSLQKQGRITFTEGGGASVGNTVNKPIRRIRMRK